MDARLNNAEAACARGQLGEAEGLCRGILADAPHDPATLNLMGIVAQRRGLCNDALSWFNAALTARPDFLQARFNRSVVLRLLDRNEDALDGLKEALRQAPDFAEAWDLAGQLFMQRCAYDDAAKCFDHATGLAPRNASFWANFGLLRYAQGDFSEAYRAAKKAESLDPTAPPFLLGNALVALGHPEEAAACFERARAIPALAPNAAASEAMARLQIGDYERGFAAWENRPVLDWKYSSAPLWDGTAVDTLLLYEDQGFGDVLQFLRFVPSIKARAAKIILCLRTPLVSLCTRQFPDIHVCAEGSSLPQATARCRLASLPFFTRTTLSSLSAAPYITASVDPEWQQRLRGVPRPRIGLAWSGNAQFRNNWNRSVDRDALAPLLKYRAHLVSLQIGGSQEASAAGLFDASPYLHSFADTAALINELDLVITVDTAIAHLAAAMGKPVFILLPFISDWRWLLGRSDSPWYATAKLFRQSTRGDWSPAISALTANVGRFLGGDMSVLKPEVWKGAPLRRHPNAISLS